MTSQRDLKQLARTRAARTGEPYAAALRAIRDQAPALSSPLPAELVRLEMQPFAPRFYAGTFENHPLGTPLGKSLLAIAPESYQSTLPILLAESLHHWSGPAVVLGYPDQIKAIAKLVIRKTPAILFDPSAALAGSEGLPPFSRPTFSPVTATKALGRHWLEGPSWDRCLGLTNSITSILVPADPKDQQDWSYWRETYRQLLAPFLLAAALDDLTITDVHSWIQSEEIATPRAIIAKAKAQFLMSETDQAAALLMLKGIDNRPDKERATVFSTAQTAFGVYQQPALRRVSAQTNFAPALLDSNPLIFIVQPHLQANIYRKVFIDPLIDTLIAMQTPTPPSITNQPSQFGLFLAALDTPGTASPIVTWAANTTLMACLPSNYCETNDEFLAMGLSEYAAHLFIGDPDIFSHPRFDRVFSGILPPNLTDGKTPAEFLAELAPGNGLFLVGNTAAIVTIPPVAAPIPMRLFRPR